MLPKAKIIYHPRFMKTLVRFDPDQDLYRRFHPTSETAVLFWARTTNIILSAPG